MSRLILALSAGLASGRPAAAEPPPPAVSTAAMTLAEALARVQRDNPELGASRKAWEAARERTEQASALDDPTITFSDMLVPLETRGDPLKGQLGVAQKVPFWGNRALHGEAASLNAEIARQAYAAKTLELFSKTVRAYYELYFLDQTTAILGEQSSVLERFARVADKKYAVGKAPQAMVFRAQVELARLATDLVTARQQILGARARLNALLDRPPLAPLAVPLAPSRPRAGWDSESLSRAALAERPELLALRALQGRRAVERRLALRRYFPDFTIGYQYADNGAGETMTSFDGRDAQSVSLGLNIPLWLGKNRAAVRESRASEDASRLSVEDLSNRTRAQVTELVVEIETAARLYQLYEDTVLPQAQSALDSTQSAYAADAAGFLDLLDAERALLRFQLEQERHRVDYAEGVAELSRVVGGPLTQSQGEKP